MTRTNRIFFQMLLILSAVLLSLTPAHAQAWEEQGKPIGKVSVVGNLILMELDEGALGQQHLFDLGQRTLRFTPGKTGYRIENLPLRWDADFGQQLSGHQVTLHNFAFPFSGKTWNSFSVGVTGSIRFGEAKPTAMVQGPASDRALIKAEFPSDASTRLSEGAANLANTVPAICVFFKPRMSGNRLRQGTRDRVVVTWDVTEP